VILNNDELAEAIQATFQLISKADPQGQVKSDATKHFAALLEVQLKRARLAEYPINKEVA